MSSWYKRILPLATIALIGLACSSVVFAQAPALVRPGGSVAVNGPTPVPPLQCERGLTLMTVLHGKIDNFAGGPDTPPPTPSPDLKLQFPVLTTLPGAAKNIFDNNNTTTNTNYLFADTLSLAGLPDGSAITVARLTTRLRPNDDNSAFSAGNDAITIRSGSNANRFSFSIKDLKSTAGIPNVTWGNNNASQAGGVDFIFTMTGTVSQTPASPPYPANFLTILAANTNKSMDVWVQDDTSVDYLQLDICFKPPIDLVAAKKRDGNLYILTVTNAGQQIMPTGRVEVVEVVPEGLIITGAGVAPWICPGVNYPVVGPDAFTCSYQVPAGGIPQYTTLPPITLKTEGRAECPNCMRVRLYLKAVSAGEKPVNEGDMKNNASCAK